MDVPGGPGPGEPAQMLGPQQAHDSVQAPSHASALLPPQILGVGSSDESLGMGCPACLGGPRGAIGPAGLPWRPGTPSLLARNPTKERTLLMATRLPPLILKMSLAGTKGDFTGDQGEEGHMKSKSLSLSSMIDPLLLTKNTLIFFTLQKEALSFRGGQDQRRNTLWSKPIRVLASPLQVTGLDIVRLGNSGQ